MKIKIVYPEFIFNVLNKAHLLEPGEESGYSKEDALEELKRNSGFSYNVVRLPEPLDAAGFSAGVTGKHYNARISIISRDEAVFDGISPKMQRYFKKKGKLFYPASKDGTGYVYNAETGIEATITDFVMKKMILGREISIGRGGGKEKLLGTLGDFKIDIGVLEALANQFIFDICLKSRKLPDLVLYMTP